MESQTPKPDHFATWTLSFALGAFGVWSTWMSYQAFGLRHRAPDWLLLIERPLFVGLLIWLTVGMLVTAYRARLFPRDDGAPQL